MATADALAEAVRGEQFDLVLTGLQSDDQGFGQVGVMLAEKLGMPHATIIMEVQVADGALRVKRELEGGWFQWIALPLPALLTIQSGINQLRYATLKGIMAAKKKEIRKVSPPAAAIGHTAHPPRLHAGEGQEDADDRRLPLLTRRKPWSRAFVTTRGCCKWVLFPPEQRAALGPKPTIMILVIAEQRDGKLNRASWEAIAAAQQAGGGPVKVAVMGAGVDAAAAGSRRCCGRRGHRARSRGTRHYTADGFVQALAVVHRTGIAGARLSATHLPDP